MAFRLRDCDASVIRRTMHLSLINQNAQFHFIPIPSHESQRSSEWTSEFHSVFEYGSYTIYQS